MDKNINYDQELDKLRVNKNGFIVSLHKPILLLLVISEIIRGHKNEFLFDDIETPLIQLMTKYGLKNTSKLNPQYPFVYLAGNSLIWNCSIDKNALKFPDSASRKEILGSFGSLNPDFFKYLRSKNNATHIIGKILTQYWPSTYHQDILTDLGIYEINTEENQVRNVRSRKFIEDVLDAYERKCAICDQSIRLSESLIGIDACHVKPIQHFGDDSITNGIALCKIHHWALDRGAISISEEMKLIVSKKLNGNKIFDYFTSFEKRNIFTPRYSEFELHKQNLEYHYKYIFVK